MNWMVRMAEAKHGKMGSNRVPADGDTDCRKHEHTRRWTSGSSSHPIDHNRDMNRDMAEIGYNNPRPESIIF